MVSPQPHGRTGRVHGHIASADDGDVLPRTMGVSSRGTLGLQRLDLVDIHWRVNAGFFLGVILLNEGGLHPCRNTHDPMAKIVHGSHLPITFDVFYVYHPFFPIVNSPQHGLGKA